MLYDLRPHQEQAISELRQSMREGKTRPVLSAPVAFGKTVVAAHIVASALDKGKRVCFTAPYTALINQTAKSFMDQGLPQPGVIQADHPWTDPSKRLQIASVQTLARRKLPDVDLVLVDECHLMYSGILKWMEESDIPFIGLSGTPYSKGMAKYYDNIIQTATMRSLIDDGFMSDYIAYAPIKPNMKGVKVQQGDYNETQAGERMSEPKIIGNIIDTWLKRGENEPTICFACNVAHANHIGKEFERVGISSQVITGKTPMEEREVYFTQFKKGNIKILINVGTLVAGFDSDVRCIIYARPTKSEMRWVQCIGRGLRIAKGKERCIILDHSGTIEELGFPDEIYYDELCDGNNVKEKKERQKAEKKEKLPQACPSCSTVKKADVHQCPCCGFAPVKIGNVEVDESGELQQIKGKKYSKQDKQRIFSELKGYQYEQSLKGKTLSDGWIAHNYKDMVGVWPKGLINKALTPGEQVRGFIKHKQIAFAKGKQKQKTMAKHNEWLERRNFGE